MHAEPADISLHIMRTGFLRTYAGVSLVGFSALGVAIVVLCSGRRGHEVALVITVLVGFALLWLLLLRLVVDTTQSMRGEIRSTLEANLHLSQRDQLTGLPNRDALEAAAEVALAGSIGRGLRVALLLIDLDRFREVNDTLGHRLGDELLTRIGPRLASALREYDLIARVGGDEFVILLTDLASAEEADTVAQRAIDALYEPFVVDGLSLLVEASAGVATGPDHGTSYDELLKKADVAMYRAKARHGGVQHYDASFDRRTVDRLALVAELQQAIERDELILEYQPKFDIRAGCFNAVEALVRWPHPERGLVPPADFVPHAEGSGLIRSLTRLVLRQGLAQLAAWTSEGIDVHVSLNVSARNLLDPTFVSDVRSELEAAAVDPRRVTLEITETAVMADTDRSVVVLRELAALGLGLSVDDFGIGHSSLAYLRRFPMTELKIDQSFVGDILDDPADAAIVRTTIELGRALGLSVVAEGVESAGVLGLLTSMGCDAAQGFHLARPMSASDAGAVLARSAIARG
jgi:diguanylate cyclase (GGDEF)-like protein